jgi:hypothetical protein
MPVGFLTGWLFASFRGWSVSYFYLVPLPMLAAKNAAAIRQASDCGVDVDNHNRHSRCGCAGTYFHLP